MSPRGVYYPLRDRSDPVAYQLGVFIPRHIAKLIADGDAEMPELEE